MTRTIPLIICLAVTSVLTIIICTFTGPAGFGFVSTAPGAADIVGGIRLPRVLAAFFVGASLAVAGAGMQSLFRNPMADPYILGTSSGGALGASFAIVFLGGFLYRSSHGLEPLVRSLSSGLLPTGGV